MNSFVLYRLPESTDIVVLSGSFSRCSYNELDLNHLNGFVINSFDNKNCFYIDRPTVTVISQHDPISLEAHFTFNAEHQPRLSKEEYLEQLHTFLEKMESKNIKKAVFSRVLGIEQNINTCETFRAMCSTYAGAFCYLFSSPETGTWMGATPEKLFYELPDNCIQIHALAGTQDASNIDWSDKEFEEQQLVTDYIVNQLQNGAFNNFKIGERETILAGKVAHLRTIISIDGDPGQLNRLIKLIHPTPAVCGTPTDKAKELILEMEPHQRKFYTGFLGPVGEELGNHLFVNLRCMELFDDGADLFLGGGITQKSVPESEWNETGLKSQTLLQVLKYS